MQEGLLDDGLGMFALTCKGSQSQDVKELGWLLHVGQPLLVRVPVSADHMDFESYQYLTLTACSSTDNLMCQWARIPVVVPFWGWTENSIDN